MKTVEWTCCSTS